MKDLPWCTYTYTHIFFFFLNQYFLKKYKRENEAARCRVNEGRLLPSGLYKKKKKKNESITHTFSSRMLRQGIQVIELERHIEKRVNGR